MVEELIPDAREISVEGISWKGEHYVLAVTDKVTTGAPHYVELGHYQPSDLPQSLQQEAIRQVKLGVQALHIEYGASHPELMITPSGRVYVTEIGGRMGGDFIGTDLVPLSTGYDFLRGVIEVSLGVFSPPKKTIAKTSGVWFYSSQTPEVRKYIEQSLSCPKSYPEIVRSELQDSNPKPLHRSADRAGYFIYQSDHRMVCAVQGVGTSRER